MAKIRTQTESGQFPSFFPVTDGIEDYTVTLDGFDQDKGVLLGGTVEFAAVLTSTIVFVDTIGLPYLFSWSNSTSVYAQFGTGKNQPDMTFADLSLFGFGTALLTPGGLASAPANATGRAFGLFLKPNQFEDDKDLELTVSAVGTFNVDLLSSLPQGDVTIMTEVNYTYVKENQITNGTTKADQIKGTKSSDVIFSKGGNDKLNGGKGDDYMRASGGKDKLFGGADGDSLSGGKGDDRLFGENGLDIVLGDDGADVLFGGRGNDYMYGGTGKDNISGDGGDDKISGEGGGDRLAGGTDKDILYGGGGKDKVYGGAGADQLFGDGSDDTLFGGSSRDSLFGGDGNDRLEGGKGTDYYTGGAGADTFVYKANDIVGGAYVRDFGRGNDRIDLTDFDVRKRDVTVEYNNDFEDVVVVIDNEVITVLEDIEVGDVTNEMILV